MRSARLVLFNHFGAGMRCTTGLRSGTGPAHPVHRRPSIARRSARQCRRICSLYADDTQSTALAEPLIRNSSLIVLASAPMTSPPGCPPTPYNSMPTRLSSFGSLHHASRTNFLSPWSGSAATTSRRQRQLATSACTLILI
jgi:hypothetical protein